MEQLQKKFTQLLLDWYNPDQRPLPWKTIKNPYFIWLSEIILQQTRVEQGTPYYHKFVKQYPNLSDLAAAKDDEVMKLWEGLGYYSRARNMLAAARHIMQEHKGIFPNQFEAILALKGVGPYTAAAIASFAYDLPHAVVDGNVYRVLSRFFGIDQAIDSTDGKKLFAELAQSCLDSSQPATYNQAIMDFGATICTPKQSKCTDCPLQEHCIAFAENRVNELPVKVKKVKKRARFFYYLEIESQQKVILEKRIHKDIWQSLYQFPLIEMYENLSDLKSLESQVLWQKLLGNKKHHIQSVSKPYLQTLTHQKIMARFLKIQLTEAPAFRLPDRYFFHPIISLQQFAFPKIFDCYLGDNSLYLNL